MFVIAKTEIKVVLKNNLLLVCSLVRFIISVLKLMEALQLSFPNLSVSMRLFLNR